MPPLEPPHVSQRGGRRPPQPGCSSGRRGGQQAAEAGPWAWQGSDCARTAGAQHSAGVAAPGYSRPQAAQGNARFCWQPAAAAPTRAVHVGGTAVGRRILGQRRHRARQLHAQREGVKVPAAATAAAAAVVGSGCERSWAAAAAAAAAAAVRGAAERWRLAAGTMGACATPTRCHLTARTANRNAAPSPFI